MDNNTRESLIQQAISTLYEAHHQGVSSISQQINFLENKGFTPIEITEILKRLNEGSSIGNNSNGWIWQIAYPLLVLSAGCLAYVVTGALEETEDEAVNVDTESEEVMDKWSEDEGALLEQDEAELNGDLNLPPTQYHVDEKGSLSGLTKALEKQSIAVERALEMASRSLAMQREEEQVRVPRWADDLVDRVTAQGRELLSLQEEVKALEEIIRSSRGHIPDEATQVATPVPTLLFRCMRSLRKTLCDIVSQKQEKNKDSEAELEVPQDVRAFCAAVRMYLQKIIDSPTISRYHRLSALNSSFKSSVGSVSGHEEVLSAVGFKRNGNYFEWTWSGTFTGKVGSNDAKEYSKEEVLDVLKGAAEMLLCVSKGDVSWKDDICKIPPECLEIVECTSEDTKPHEDQPEVNTSTNADDEISQEVSNSPACSDSQKSVMSAVPSSTIENTTSTAASSTS